ncbi:MAG: nucleotidyl transferase AbiEii/AbiGii toxin family protein [Deltaproteobacteria bacterium]|nr:nucleotidyl transferase AbiEii/AbiGii toxin family protein [Deltaproteobacteria bacterium]MBW2084375.1 nucleotidyl transferase AbiEii/AbiGii toxin family protein [Deltaproteobacteria bacterium]HDM09014.1 nucleotidyl transferase AbiEii/AbiGii toxin family protein [Desulfobacteraceae bacterium]
MPPPRIRAYPKETVVAEKLQAMVALGMVNSRMKDFYDIWIISKQFPFEGSVLTHAIRATFERRRTQIPKGIPTALSDEFVVDQEKSTQWKAFVRRTLLEDQGVDLSLVINELRNFLIPPL